MSEGGGPSTRERRFVPTLVEGAEVEGPAPSGEPPREGTWRRLWIRWLAALPTNHSVLIMDGMVTARRGRIDRVLLQELSELAQEYGIRTACIRVKATGGRSYAFRFHGVPTALHQRFRNVWVANSR